MRNTDLKSSLAVQRRIKQNKGSQWKKNHLTNPMFEKQSMYNKTIIEYCKRRTQACKNEGSRQKSRAQARQLLAKAYMK